MKTPLPSNWSENFWRFFAGWAFVFFLVSLCAWALWPAFYVLLGSSLMAAEFRLMELLLAVFTGTRKANATALVLLFTLKLATWFALVGSPLYLPHGMGIYFGTGCLALLLSIMTLLVWAYGPPKISSPQERNST